MISKPKHTHDKSAMNNPIRVWFFPPEQRKNVLEYVQGSARRTISNSNVVTRNEECVLVIKGLLLESAWLGLVLRGRWGLKRHEYGTAPMAVARSFPPFSRKSFQKEWNRNRNAIAYMTVRPPLPGVRRERTKGEHTTKHPTTTIIIIKKEQTQNHIPNIVARHACGKPGR